MNLAFLTQPSFVMRLADKILPFLWALTAAFFAVGLYYSFNAPEDYQQGKTVLIMFIHVPFAWASMGVYFFMALSSIGTLVWKHPLADVSAKAAAPIGATFALLCLITGSLWGKPMWGTYWVWDARLTSMLILFLLYLGIIAIWQTGEEPLKAGRIAAILTLVGVVNLPLIKFSVEWWNTLHQPASVLRLGGSAIHPALLTPLLIMAAAVMMLFLTLHLANMRNELLARRLRAKQIKAAFGGQS
jgi:heme exporter protein C